MKIYGLIPAYWPNNWPLSSSVSNLIQDVSEVYEWAARTTTHIFFNLWIMVCSGNYGMLKPSICWALVFNASYMILVVSVRYGLVTCSNDLRLWLYSSISERQARLILPSLLSMGLPGQKGVRSWNSSSSQQALGRKVVSSCAWPSLASYPWDGLAGIYIVLKINVVNGRQKFSFVAVAGVLVSIRPAEVSIS